MIRILVVCSHNSCRSPLAAGVLSKKFQEKNIPAFIDSAGLEPHLIGERVDPITREYALEKGIDISQHVIKLFSPSDFDKFDKIYVMDNKDYKDVKFHARNRQDVNKIDYLLDILMPGEKKAIPHIVDMEKRYLKEAYRLIDRASDLIVASFKTNKEAK